jgi:hypothetical protein
MNTLPSLRSLPKTRRAKARQSIARIRKQAYPGLTASSYSPEQSWDQLETSDQAEILSAFRDPDNFDGRMAA